MYLVDLLMKKCVSTLGSVLRVTFYKGKCVCVKCVLSLTVKSVSGVLQVCLYPFVINTSLVFVYYFIFHHHHHQYSCNDL